MLENIDKYRIDLNLIIPNCNLQEISQKNYCFSKIKKKKTSIFINNFNLSIKLQEPLVV